MAPMKSLMYCMPALLLSAMVIGAEAQCGGLMDSCTEYRIYPSGLLVAACDSSSPFRASKIELNDYMSNNDGNLILGAGFADTCVDFRISTNGNTLNLFATCQPSDVNAPGHVTAFNINYYISVNSDFHLVWNNCRRRSLLDSTVQQAKLPGNAVAPFNRKMTL